MSSLCEWICMFIYINTDSNGWSLGMDKWYNPAHCWSRDYQSILELKLNQASKIGPWCVAFIQEDVYDLFDESCLHKLCISYV